MKKIVKFNVVIAIVQFLILALLLFAIFFVKFRMDRTTGAINLGDQFEETKSLTQNQNGTNVISKIIAVEG